MKLRAFNLLPGAAILAGDDRAVVVEVADRDADREVITVELRFESLLDTTSLASFGYCEQVELIGLVVNEDDEDDWDFGV